MFGWEILTLLGIKGTKKNHENLSHESPPPLISDLGVYRTEVRHVP
jgi:hypothetical protein